MDNFEFLYKFAGESENYLQQITEFRSENKTLLATLRGKFMSMSNARTFLYKYAEQENVSTHVLREKITKVTALINEFENHFETYKSNILQLEFLNVDEFGELVHHVESKVADWTDSINLLSLDFEPPPLSGGVSVQTLHSETDVTAHSSLPQISLPSFNGADRTEFKPFFDLFLTIIDQREGLSEIAK